MEERKTECTNDNNRRVTDSDLDRTDLEGHHHILDSSDNTDTIDERRNNIRSHPTRRILRMDDISDSEASLISSDDDDSSLLRNNRHIGRTTDPLIDSNRRIARRQAARTGGIMDLSVLEVVESFRASSPSQTK